MKSIRPTLAILLALVSAFSFGQNYTSISDGNWTNPSVWNNTDNWGTATPPIDGSHYSGTISLQNDISILTNYTIGNSTLNVLSGHNLIVSGNLTSNGGSRINVFGTLTILGNLSLEGHFTVHPGGKVIVEGSVAVIDANYLAIGTNSSAPPFSDMIIYQNLVQQTSGDVTINSNGRLAVFGNVSDSGGGGTFIRVNDGGQVYVHGDINYSGGRSFIENNNSSDPYGLYVNGSTNVNTGQDGKASKNIADQSTMQSTNPDFFNWVATQNGSPLPVVLMFFKAQDQSLNTVELIWATASEQDNDYFTIERSKNGIDYEVLAQIKGNGTSHTQSDYSFSDLNPLPGISYYRLSQTDFDGTKEEFPTISVNIRNFQMTNVFPNPTKDGELYIQAYDRLINNHLNLNLFDLRGHLVYATKLQLNAFGDVDAKISFPKNIEKGTYVLRLLSENYSETQKIFLE